MSDLPQGVSASNISFNYTLEDGSSASATYTGPAKVWTIVDNAGRPSEPQAWVEADEVEQRAQLTKIAGVGGTVVLIDASVDTLIAHLLWNDDDDSETGNTPNNVYDESTIRYTDGAWNTPSHEDAEKLAKVRTATADAVSPGSEATTSAVTLPAQVILEGSEGYEE